MANRFCTKCGSAASDGQRFCKVCGQPLAQAAAPPSDPTPVFRPALEPLAGIESPGYETGQALAVKTCLKCGTVLTPDQRSCWVCGQPVGSLPDPVAAHSWGEVATPPPAAPASQSAAPASLATCTKCGAVLTADQQSCWVCGTPVGALPVTPPFSDEPIPQATSAPEPVSNANSFTRMWAEVTPAAESNPAAAPSWSTPEPVAATAQPWPAPEPYPDAGATQIWTRPAVTPATPLSDPAPELQPSTPAPVPEPEPDQAADDTSTPSTSAFSSPSSWPETVPPASIAPEPTPAPEAFCPSCHASLTPGQKFCRTCGTPVAASASVADSTISSYAPEPSSSSASLSQASLSQAWAAESVIPASAPLAPPPPPVIADTAASAPLPAAAPLVVPTEPIRCPTCRTVLAADQRICWVCGQVLGAIKQPETLAEMGAPTHTYVEVAVAIPEATGAKPETTAPIPPSAPPAVPSAFPPPQSYTPVVPSAPPPPAYTPLSPANYPPQPPPPPPGPTYAATMPPIKDQRNYFDSVPSAPSVAPVPVVRKSSNAGLWILLLVLVLGAGGAGAWYFHSRTTDHSSGSVTPAAPIDAGGVGAFKPAAATPAPLPTSDQANAPAPSAESPAVQPTQLTEPANSQDSPQSQTPPPPVPAPTPPVRHTSPPVSTHSNPTPPPEPGPVPPLDPLPTQPTSGTLRYSGPPVAQNGLVVFDHLPAARMRFTFDRDSWQPIISHNPDGTQKLTLRSTRPGTQTECIVQWQTVP